MSQAVLRDLILQSFADLSELVRYPPVYPNAIGLDGILDCLLLLTFCVHRVSNLFLGVLFIDLLED